MRQEGSMWNAYWAQTDTMKDSILLGSLLMALTANAEVKQRFLDTMRNALGEAIFQELGIRPEWGGVQLAPEHEKAGNA